MSENGINILNKGLFNDKEVMNQAEGSYLFALNAVNMTDQGEYSSKVNEESNEICASLPTDFIIIGKVYMYDDKYALLLVHKSANISEIGIYDMEFCTYTTHVNDSTSLAKDKLNFSLAKQAQIIYRLRRGCEHTIYWVAKDMPKYYNFSSPDDFKNSNNEWVNAKFNLQKHYEAIPEFTSISTVDSGGTLPPGSYSFAIQLLDEDFNTTEYITSSPSVKIYSDSITKPFAEISGSIKGALPIDFSDTSKSIKVVVNNLDPNYVFYRLAIICCNSGTGEVNEVLVTQVIPTQHKTFIFTGTNYEYKIAEDEVKAFTGIISYADSITQVDDRLILGDIADTKASYCELQRFASQIKSDCIVKEVVLNDIKDPSNPRNPNHEIVGGIEYMPGEIYSFGIVYIYDNYTYSPVCHIAGRESTDAGIVFDPKTDQYGQPTTYPMSTDNESDSAYYVDIPTCDSGDYWGRNYNGTKLLGKKVRHHRFPLRSDIGLPLVTNTYSNKEVVTYYKVLFNLTGNLKLPVDCPSSNPTCGTDVYHVFTFRISYVVDGQNKSFTVTVDPLLYADGVSNSGVISISETSELYGSGSIFFITVEVSDTSGVFHSITGFDFSPYFIGTPTISTSKLEEDSEVYNKLVTSKMYGISFSNIKKPVINGSDREVIGYYIVRQNRSEFDKSVLDTGVLFPMTTQDVYTAHGLLLPDYHYGGNEYKIKTKNATTLYSLLNPEFKFLGKKYSQIDRLIEQGTYSPVATNSYGQLAKYGLSWYNDVKPGTGYDENHNKKNSNISDSQPADGNPASTGLDGWSLVLASRDYNMDYRIATSFDIPYTNITSIFYLDALDSQAINEFKHNVFNIACDNKIGVVHFDTPNLIPSYDLVPYVVMYRDIQNPYQDFMTRPYYKEQTNPTYFNTPIKNEILYNGDTYISPMRYSNSMFIDNLVAKRPLKSGTWKIVVGVFLVVAGIIASIFTAGAGLAISIVGMTLVTAALGVLLLSSGVKTANFNKTYIEHYKKGLRENAYDTWSVSASSPYNTGLPHSPNTFGDGYSDDSIVWITDCMTDLWFETSVNTHLRNGFATPDYPTYLPSPWRSESGQDGFVLGSNFNGGTNYSWVNSGAARYPKSTLEVHTMNKLLGYSDEGNDSRRYLGLALGDYYNVNPDYYKRNTQKLFFHLALEYDCCSDCQEKFPHRVKYSEQSFQEELTDNYRVFLPNNYRDIPGETGRITNLYSFLGEFYIHTESALWLVPRGQQERVTDQIVSFIGTGDFFAIPPKKIIDDETGNSSGCKHKWGTIISPHGILFITEDQNAINLFDGRGIKPISKLGYNTFFKDNLKIQLDLDYNKTIGTKYPFENNPSNPFGTGFISVYDSKKERFIVTKKDYILNTISGDARIVIDDSNNLVLFNNYQETIDDMADEGKVFMGIRNGKMTFEKLTLGTTSDTIENFEIIEEPCTRDIHIIIDTSTQLGDWTDTCVDDLRSLISSYITQYKIDNPRYTGNYYEHEATTGAWLEYLQLVDSTYSPVDRVDTEVSVIMFSVNGDTFYHDDVFDGNITSPTTKYGDDLTYFKDNIYPYYKSFSTILCPVLINGDSVSCSAVAVDIPSNKNNILHTIAAWWGDIMRPLDVSENINPVNMYLDASDNSLIQNSLQTANPYSDGLINYGMSYYKDIRISADGIDFKDTDMARILNNELEYLQKEQRTSENRELIPIEILDYTANLGVTLPEGLLENNSWTISFDIAEKYWVSLHSYLPNVYIGGKEKFSSFISSGKDIWKHNKLGNYQTFYGTRHPFILEFASLSTDMSTKIWDYIKFVTRASKYDVNTKTFFEDRFTTFNKALFYNSRQCSGILNLVVKDTHTDSEDYLMQQVQNLSGDSIILDRNEIDWTLNDMRDFRIDYTKPMFDKTIISRKPNYYIDKVVTAGVIDHNKDWKDLESFRDKYLVIRFIFDNFADVKLIFNYSVEPETTSFR